MKRDLLIISFIVMLFFGFLGVTYSVEYNDKESLKFEMVGPTVLYMDINSEYVEYGVIVTKKGKDISDLVRIDSSDVNIHEVGEYMVKYEIDVDGNKEYVYRIVKVIDEETPKISLKGEEIVYLILNGTYYEEGFVVSDNLDNQLDDSVSIIGNVDTSKVGEYKLEYKVVDSNGNIGRAYRTVIVMEPKVTLADISSNKVIYNLYDASRYSNTIVKNKWNDTGIYVEGYTSDRTDNYKIKLKNKDNSLEYIYNMKNSKSNYYSGNINFTLIPNGEYDIYIVGDKEERLLNKLHVFARLLRSKVGNRLVTFTYDDNGKMGVIISDFKYEYDIVIDPGHGARDVGASNGIKYEKDINLEQSMYEKCRYESMGLKVFMTRYDDSYGTMMGSEQIDHLQRRALTIGYYGAVSKITYSNHHNASVNSNDHGFEIIVSNKLTDDELVVEKNLYNKYKEFYKITDNNIRLYSRDYDTDRTYNKLNGDVYSYMDYYAVIRIPNELFNVKTIIFEPMYMSNTNDFNWYYVKDNWITVTEIKIREYVEYLGKKYINDNSMCL